MSKQLGSVERLDNGNIALTLGGMRCEFTPDHVDALVRQLLSKAHPREAVFVIPVARGDAG
jgi:hypothetical protein